MHNVKKADLSNEQKVAKEKEREKKLAAFVIAKQKLLQKFENGEFDEELLALSKPILMKNPDYYTLWNMRRTVLLKFLQEKVDQSERFLNDDLELTKDCLMHSHPKSYGAWFHRGWVLAKMQHPDYKRELELCNRALQEDERNFHCWDHRRLVAERAHVLPQQELEFSDQKVNDNFSNYSNWHYRSILLPVVYPPDDSSKTVTDCPKLLHEFELVQNAFFTDPDDQSCFFYHDWLVEGQKFSRSKVSSAISSTLDIPHILFCDVRLCCDPTKFRVVLTFDHPVYISVQGFDVKLVDMSGDRQQQEIKFLDDWHGVEKYSRCNSIWINQFQSPTDGPPLQLSKLKFVIEKNDSLNQSITDQVVIDLSVSSTIGSDFDRCILWQSSLVLEQFRQQKLPDAITDSLASESQMCDQLLEIENSKWPLFLQVKLLIALDYLTNKTKIFAMLEKLMQLDSKRLNFYRDFRSKLLIGEKLAAFLEIGVVGGRLDLSGLDLSCLCYQDCMLGVEVLDLSGNNNIRALKAALRPLLNLKTLIGVDDAQQYLPAM